MCKRFKQNEKMVQAQADFVELIAMEILFRLGMKTHSNMLERRRIESMEVYTKKTTTTTKDMLIVSIHFSLG